MFELASLEGCFGCSLVLDTSLESFRRVSVGIFDFMLTCRDLSYTVALQKYWRLCLQSLLSLIPFFCFSKGSFFLRTYSLLLSVFMTLFSHGSSFRCMVFVTLSGNGSSLISITFFILDGNVLLFPRYFFLFLPVSLFISGSTLKSTFPSST